MSKMAELVTEMEELAEQGFSAITIAARLGVPLEWADTVVEERWNLEQQKQNQMIGYENDW